jgi:hypothetical protein
MTELRRGRGVTFGRWVVVVTAVVLFGVACGPSDDDSSASTTTTDDTDSEDSERRSPPGPPSPPPPPPGGPSSAALMLERCYWGDMSACDYLANRGAGDATEEHIAYGHTCGGRLDEPPPLPCYMDIEDPDFPPLLPPTPPPSGDPTYDGMAASCYQGEMQACNDLRNHGTTDDPGPGAPIGSAYYDYAVTCGGRLPPQQMANCIDLEPDPN